MRWGFCCYSLATFDFLSNFVVIRFWAAIEWVECWVSLFFIFLIILRLGLCFWGFRRFFVGVGCRVGGGWLVFVVPLLVPTVGAGIGCCSVRRRVGFPWVFLGVGWVLWCFVLGFFWGWGGRLWFCWVCFLLFLVRWSAFVLLGVGCSCLWVRFRVRSCWWLVFCCLLLGFSSCFQGCLFPFRVCRCFSWVRWFLPVFRGSVCTCNPTLLSLWWVLLFFFIFLPLCFLSLWFVWRWCFPGRWLWSSSFYAFLFNFWVCFRVRCIYCWRFLFCGCGLLAWVLFLLVVLPAPFSVFPARRLLISWVCWFISVVVLGFLLWFWGVIGVVAESFRGVAFPLGLRWFCRRVGSGSWLLLFLGWLFCWVGSTDGFLPSRARLRAPLAFGILFLSPLSARCCGCVARGASFGGRRAVIAAFYATTPPTADCRWGCCWFRVFRAWWIGWRCFCFGWGFRGSGWGWWLCLSGVGRTFFPVLWWPIRFLWLSFWGWGCPGVVLRWSTASCFLCVVVLAFFLRSAGCSCGRCWFPVWCTLVLFLGFWVSSWVFLCLRWVVGCVVLWVVVVLWLCWVVLLFLIFCCWLIWSRWLVLFL